MTKYRIVKNSITGKFQAEIKRYFLFWVKFDEEKPSYDQARLGMIRLHNYLNDIDEEGNNLRDI